MNGCQAPEFSTLAPPHQTSQEPKSKAVLTLYENCAWVREIVPRDHWTSELIVSVTCTQYQSTRLLKSGQFVSQGCHSGMYLGKPVLFFLLGDKVLSSKDSLSFLQTLEDPCTCLSGFTDLDVPTK